MATREPRKRMPSSCPQDGHCCVLGRLGVGGDEHRDLGAVPAGGGRRRSRRSRGRPSARRWSPGRPRPGAKIHARPMALVAWPTCPTPRWARCRAPRRRWPTTPQPERPQCRQNTDGSDGRRPRRGGALVPAEPGRAAQPAQQPADLAHPQLDVDTEQRPAVGGRGRGTAARGRARRACRAAARRSSVGGRPSSARRPAARSVSETRRGR